MLYATAVAVMPLMPILPVAGPAPALSSLTESMERAVLAADVEGYMALVDGAAPEFLVEQRMWARDLTTHPVEAFDIELDEEGIVQHEQGVRAPLTMRWNLPGEDEPRSVSFTASFAPAPTGDGWRYAGPAWDRIEERGVAVYFEPEHIRTAEMILDVLPVVREVVEQELGRQAPRPQAVKIYPSMRRLQASIYLSYTDTLGGWNEPREAIKILPNQGHGGSPSRRGLEAVLSHEYGHAVTFAMGADTNHYAWWLAEGVAEVVSARYSRSAASCDQVVRGWARADNLAPWEDITDFRNTPDRYHSHVYVQGQHMVQFVGDTFGTHARNAWIEAAARTHSVEAATEEALGITFQELDRRWLDTLDLGGS